MEPIININRTRLNDLPINLRQQFVASCPRLVYDFNDATSDVRVAHPEKCVFCDECVIFASKTLDNCGDLVSVKMDTSIFHFTVEVLIFFSLNYMK